MGRILFVAALIYAAGHPALDGQRPALFDRPLRSFHAEIDRMARDTRRAWSVLDDAGSMRHLRPLIDQIGAMLDANR